MVVAVMTMVMMFAVMMFVVVTMMVVFVVMFVVMTMVMVNVYCRAATPIILHIMCIVYWMNFIGHFQRSTSGNRRVEARSLHGNHRPLFSSAGITVVKVFIYPRF